MAERTNPHANLIIGAQDEASPVFDKIKASSQSMAAGVEQAATKAAASVGGIGDKAAPAAQKLDSVTSSMIRQVQRLNAELEAGGARNAAYFEKMASVKGADLSAMAPYLADLKKAEAAQRVATTGLNTMGMSAKQTAAALRQVPMQFTDIVVSLQGGQSAMQVFLQQGGQLKDMFGGAGNAVRAMGGYVMGLINPFTLAAAAVAGIAVAYNQGAKEADAYRAALVTTGNAAGTNAAQLKSYAQEISSVVGTQGKAAEALSALAATGKVGAENLREAAQAAVAYERATGQAASKTAEQFASLRNEPLAAVLKLNEGMNFLTDSTYRQIKSLEEQGRTAKAANVAQRAFADTLSGRAGEMERNLGTVERGWLAVKDAAKSAWDAILNVGRASTSVDQLAEVRKQIAQRENQIANGGFGTNEGGAAFGRPSQAATERLRAELAGLQAKAAALEGVAYATRVSAEEERKRGEAVKAGAAFDKAGEKFLSDKTRMERELAAARVQGAEAGRSQAEIEKRLSEIRASYAKKGGSSVATENKELRDQQRIFAELAGVSSTYYSELANYQKQRAAGVATEDQYVAAVEKLIQKQPFAVELAKEETEANKALSKSYAEAAAERIKTIQSMERAADSLQSQNDALREEIELIGLSTEQQTLVLQQRNDVIILTKEATLAELERQSAITGTQTRVEIALASEIDALKERNALLGAKGVKNAAVDAAKSAADEWQKTSDKINDTLTDALMRGFESGKDFAKNLRDTVVNMFKTLVLRPIISAVVNPVAGALTGALGLSGAAQAATGGASALGMLGNVGSIAAAGLGTFGTAAGYGASALFAGNGIGALAGGAGMVGAGSLAGGFGMIAGVLGPIALGVGALAAIAKATKGETRTGGQFGVAFDGAVTNNRRDQTYTIEGQQFDRDFTNGLQTALRDGLTYRLEGDPVAQESAIKAAVSGTASGINGILKALGSEARLAGFSAGLETSGKGRGGVFAGGTFADGRTFGESGKGDNYQGTLYEKFSTNSPDFKAALENFTLDLKQSTIQALQTVTDIPKSVKSLLDGVDAEGLADDAANALLEAINAQILGVDQLKQAFATIGFDKLAALSFDAASGLAAASGGFDKLIANLDTYYSNFFSADEQRAQIQKNLQQSFASLNLTLPDIDATDARAQFRALVESASGDLSETGQKTYAALLQLSGSFAQITPEAAAVVQAVESVSQAMQRLTGDSASLQIDLLRAQGNTTGADAAQRTLDTTGLSDAEIAIYDYNTSLRSQIGALNDAAQATADQAAIRADFERQLLQLQGDTAGLRLLDIAGMDSYNVSLYDQVQALTEAQAAAQAATQAQEQQASARLGFERQLLTLQNDTAALRALDVAGMDAANVALYDRVQALTAAQAAEQVAAQAAQEQAGIRAGLERQLLQLAGDTAGLRALDVAGMDALNEALYDQVQAQSAAAAAAQEVTRAAEQQASTRMGLERQLLTLQNDTAALRLLDIAGMDAANVALYDRVQALTASQAAEQAAAQAAQAAAQAALQAEQELAAKREQVAQQAYGIETQLLQLQGNTAALRARELAALDPANRADQLRVYALTDAQAATNAAADAERDLAATRVQSAQDAYRAAQESTGSAFDALSRSVGEERAIYESARSAAADAAQEIKSVIDTLTGSIQDLYAGVDSTRQASAAEGASFITAALRAARSTGYLPDAAGLSDAITAARGGLGAQNFATQFEADRAQLVIAGQLSELSDIAKPQLTAAERTLRNAENQLKTLDDILKNAQSQVDAVRGISTTVGTIPAALAGLQSALLSEAQAKALAQAATPPVATPPADTPKTSGLSGPYAALVESALKSAAYTTDDRLVYDTARMFNVTSSELDKLMGWTAGTSLEWAKKNKLPEFAVGTNYVPQDMAAIVHKGEMIVPAAYNPATSGAASNNAEVVSELRALRKQNERMEARLASIEGSNTTMANLLDEVTEGGNAMRSEVMA